MSKPNKLTKGCNLRWEGSRIMLPEHVSMLHKHKMDQKKKKKPEFDEQYLTELSLKIQEAKQKSYTVTLTIFDEFNDIEITGVIVFLDAQLGRLKIVSEQEEIHWISFEDIIDIHMLNSL